MTEPPAPPILGLSHAQAAEILGVGKTRLDQLVHAGKIPNVQRGRRRFYRRPQLDVIANARDARRAAGGSPGDLHQLGMVMEYGE